MKRDLNMKKFIAIALALCTLLSFVSCGLLTGFDAKGLVQGNLDSIFLNKHSSEYLKRVDLTEEDAQKEYRQGLEIEAQYFASYWGIVEEDFGEVYEDLDEALKNDIVELLDDIYSHTKYELGDVTSSSDRYTVEVTVYPIDIYEKAIDAIENYMPYNAWLDKYENVDTAGLSASEYAAYTTEYGNAIVGLVRTQLNNIGYKDAKSFAIRVERVDEVWGINQEDFDMFDSYVIYYG